MHDYYAKYKEFDTIAQNLLHIFSDDEQKLFHHYLSDASYVFLPEHNSPNDNEYIQQLYDILDIASHHSFEVSECLRFGRFGDQLEDKIADAIKEFENVVYAIEAAQENIPEHAKSSHTWLEQKRIAFKEAIDILTFK